MHEFTDREIELVSCEIEQQGLTYDLLKHEMIDHICCDIEAEMESGLTFNQAYKKIKSRMGNRRIKQIQDETLYLINKKYRRMKKTMYGLGIAVPILIVIAFIFKLMHWPGAGILITLALFTAAVLFLPMFVMVRIRDTRKENEDVPMGFYISGMISGILTILGALFKIQHMPGAGIMLTLGIITMSFVFLPIYASVKIKSARKKNEPVKPALYIVGVIAGILFVSGALFKIMHWPGAGYVIIVSWIVVSVLLLPLLILNILKQKGRDLNNFLLVVLSVSIISLLVLAQLRSPSRTLLEGFISRTNNLVSNSEYFSSQSLGILNAAKEAGHSESYDRMVLIHSEADKIADFIQTLEKDLILEADNGNTEALGAEGIDYFMVRRKDDARASYVILIGHGPSDARGRELKAMLESFRETALSMTENAELSSLIEAQLNLSSPMGPEEKSWEQYYFTGPLVQTANNLNMYGSILRQIEYELIREISSREEE